ncbi:NAD(P)-binding domain-containing protein [Pseudomonas sp. MSSRFD41]|uniref:flavin-containing monooxygenase n=1 Tax=Pseudomonas sp. MSSRFD41 TaxID=1310370 RepID=UPI001639D573|nr:NAD(P)-binding domain-containing protein [Pseudomonas sp. MSSRFD41]MBC2660083.1 NAD(P)-binding domain-containing protein [Pseudomonas sp. MSSRFD41]
MSSAAKVAIIGGGPTGLAIGRELNAAGIDFVLYEAEADFGGVWNSEGDSGRTYPSLHLISPKSNTQFPDFPMPAEYPDYPNHRLMLAYLRSYAARFGLYERAQFGTRVERLEPHAQGWQVHVAQGGREFHELVVICNGLQRTAYFPSIPCTGFAGEILHAADYKSPDQLRGKRVLVIGGGNSGCDIATDAVHHAERVYHSTRRGYYYQPKFIHGMPTALWMREIAERFSSKEGFWQHVLETFKVASFDGADYGLPKPDYPISAAHPIMNSHVLFHIGHGDIVPKGDVVALVEGHAQFADRSREQVDMVIYATGYSRNLSFIDPQLLQWRDGIPDLFLHCAPRNHDNLLCMGFVNAAGGLGDAAKIQGNFVLNYARAFLAKTRGLEEFNEAKCSQQVDLGQEHFIKSRRHLWEADLWKYLAQIRTYSNMLKNV